jgi:hypothetical protein
VGGERFFKASKGHPNFGRDPVLVMLYDRGLFAPRKKLRITGHIGDQVVHLLGTEPNEHRFMDGFHKQRQKACSTMDNPSRRISPSIVRTRAGF